MKKTAIVLITTLLIGLYTFKNSMATDISAGVTTWYSWWNFKEDGNSKREIDPTLLFGPALSVKISEDFNASLVFLYGIFEMDEDNGTKDITRIDSDFALNYRINNYIKLFIGGKYMGYTMTDFYHRSAGPGAGLSMVVPVIDSFFVIGNLSGLYLWGKHNDVGSEQMDMIEYGINSTLSVAYYISPASTTISLGGRYQYFKTKYDSSTSPDLSHDFYGVTLSAIYTF